jgi:hypothetical protein
MRMVKKILKLSEKQQFAQITTASGAGSFSFKTDSYSDAKEAEIHMMAGKIPTISIISPKTIMKNEVIPIKKIFHPCPFVSFQLSSTDSIGSSFLSITIYDTNASLHAIIIPGIISAKSPITISAKTSRFASTIVR